MELWQVVAAVKAINELAEEKLDYPVAHQLVLLKKQLTPHFEFFLQEELKLANEYANKDDEGNAVMVGANQLKCDDPQKALQYQKEHGKLSTVNVDVPWQIQRLPAPAEITIKQIEALEPFIRFVEE